MGIMRDLAANLYGGARLAFFLPSSGTTFRPHGDQALALFVVITAIAIGGSYMLSGGGSAFSALGFLSKGTEYLILLLGLYAVARLAGGPNRYVEILVVVLAATVWVTGLSFALLWLLSRLTSSADGAFHGLWLTQLALPVWGLAVVFRGVSLVYQVPTQRALECVVVFALCTWGAAFALPSAGFWQPLRSEQIAPHAGGPAVLDWSPYLALDVERITHEQPLLMARAAGTLADERPGVTDLYFLGFGGYAYQDVFMKEVVSVRTLFDRRFDTHGRSVALVNNLKTLDVLPLANQSNLAGALQGLAQRMNTEEDVLFLFLTSHGSEDHRLASEFHPFAADHLSANQLDQMLDQSGIKWRIVVVSACFSGGFIDALQDDHSLIITAARSDRTSFGCNHLNDYTYFGQAYFDQQLREQSSFVDAFHDAVATITARERSERLPPSEPQISLGRAMSGKLRELENRISQLDDKATD